MVIENEILRYVIYGVAILIASIISGVLFKYTLSPLARFVNSPIAILGMFVSYVFTAAYFTYLITSGLIEPKKEPSKYDSNNSESVKKYNALSDTLEKNGITKISEKIVFFEKNQKSLVIETVFENKSANAITFGYVVQFLNPDKTIFATTTSDVISLEPGEIYSYNAISPSSVSGEVFVEKRLSVKGIFIEVN